jgi:hypothetical protein
MQHNLSTGVTGSTGIGRVDKDHFTASIRSFACEVCGKQAPACIKDAFGQMAIFDHITDAKIFDRHMIVGGKQPMTQLIEEIPALVPNTLVFALQDDHSLTPIRSPFLSTGDPALCHTQPLLRSAVPGRMFNVFALTGRNERGEPYINTNIDTRFWQRFRRDFTRQHDIPLARFAGKSEGLDRSRYFPMPAHRDTTDTSNLESAAIKPEAIPIFFKREALKAMFPLKSWITGFLTGFDTAEEGLKRLVQILHHSLQHMAVDRASIRIAGFIGFHLAQLFVLADSALFLLVGVFALC